MHHLLKYSSWLIYESVKALYIKFFMLVNLVIANNAIISYPFFLFHNYWIIIFNWLIIAEIFSSNTQLVIPTRIPNRNAKAEIETHPLIPEAK